ncbi:MAG: pitrilysin family protein [Terriglobia bacterium]
MNKFLWNTTRCALLTLLWIGGGTLAKDNPVFNYPTNRAVLENGLKVYTVPFDSPGIVSFYTVVRVGSRNEVEPGHSGFAHFFEHMMFRGTEKYPKQTYNDVLKAVGADHNAFTDNDMTVYHILASSSSLETIMQLESDRFMNLKYSEQDFKTEAGAILGEYNKSFSSPMEILFEKMQDTAYVAHPYKHTTIGFLKDIMDMPNQFDYSLQFFERWYRPENCALIVVGDVKKEQVVGLAKKYYGGWKQGNYQGVIPPEPPQTEEKKVAVSWKSETLPLLAIGYHGPAFSDTSFEMPAMDLFSQLYFSQNSDLYRQLVIEDQLVESLFGGQQDSRDPGLFLILARVKDPKNLEKVRQFIDSAIKEAESKPISAERLAAVKSHLKYSFAMGLDNPDAVARVLSNYFAMTGDPDSVNRVYAIYDQITASQIQEIVKKYFQPTNRTQVVLTKEGESK